MPKMRMTAKSAENAKAPAKGQIDYFDEARSGFALRVTDKGRKSWVLFYRVQDGPDKGKQRRFTIGRYPAIGLHDARVAADGVLSAVEKGGDPAKEKQVAKLVEADEPDVEPEPIWTFDRVADKYIDQYARPRKRSWRDDELRLRVHVRPKWGGKPIDTITRADVDALIEGIASKGTPIAANRTLAVVRKLFNWAITKPMFRLDASPVVRIEAPGAETRRDRYLRDDELRLFWQACEEVGHPFGPFARLLLLTGSRREMVAAMRWSDIDADKRLWTVPGEFMKSGREHLVPLSELALATIDVVPKMKGTDYVFPAQRVRQGRKIGDSHISGYSKAKRQLDAKMLEISRKAAAERGDDPDEVTPIPGWTFHDLRRTATTHMGELRIPRHVRKLILDHVERDVTGIYDRYEYLDERRDALELWAGKVERLLHPSAGNVVPLRA